MIPAWRWIAALPAAIAAASALACASVAYLPQPPAELRFATLDELARKPPAIRMSAGGKAVLVLPLAHPRGTWSVMPEPLEAVAVYGSISGRGKARVSRHEFDYRLLNPHEVSALESGKAFELASTRWKNTTERVIPLRLAYHVGSWTLREFSGTLHVERGAEVMLPPLPVVVSVGLDGKTNASLSLGREFVIRLPLDTAKGWRLTLAEAEIDPTVKGPLELRDAGPRDAAQEFKGVAQGRIVRLRFEPATDASATAAAIELELPVLPAPKC